MIFSVLPVCQCHLQSCQCQVRRPLHSHQSWKQLECQLPLRQRDYFIEMSVMVWLPTQQLRFSLSLSLPPPNRLSSQENCRSPSQNHKAKDASSDSSKGQRCWFRCSGEDVCVCYRAVIFFCVCPFVYRRHRCVCCTVKERAAGSRDRNSTGRSRRRPAACSPFSRLAKSF